MLVHSRLLAIDQVHQTCIVRVWRQSEVGEFCVSWCAGGIDAGVNESLQLVGSALKCGACDAGAVAKGDLDRASAIVFAQCTAESSVGLSVTYISPSHNGSSAPNSQRVCRHWPEVGEIEILRV